MLRVDKQRRQPHLHLPCSEASKIHLEMRRRRSQVWGKRCIKLLPLRCKDVT